MQYAKAAGEVAAGGIQAAGMGADCSGMVTDCSGEGSSSGSIMTSSCATALGEPQCNMVKVQQLGTAAKC